MGNTFTAQGFKDALSWQNVVEGIKHPDTTPRTGSMPTFDAHEGFDYQRKPRGNVAFFSEIRPFKKILSIFRKEIRRCRNGSTPSSTQIP